MPLFGSVLSLTKAVNLQLMFDVLYLWLDPDKQRESIEQCKLIQTAGIPIIPVLADKDPKEFTTEEINNICQAHLI